MQPLSPVEFRDALRKGLGRAILHVKEHGADGLMEDILHAATHNLAYDPQMNGNRYDWILWLIRKTKQVEFFREPILEALRQSRETWDLSLLYALAAEFAEGGDEEARAAIYEKFERQEVDKPWLGGTSLVCLYGMEGFLHVAEVIGARMRRDPAYRKRLQESGDNYYLIGIAEEKIQRDEIIAALRERAASNEAIRIYLEECESYLCKEECRSATTEPPDQLTAEEILASIERLEWTKRYQAKRSFRRLSPDALNRIYESMFAETRRDQLLRYFWLFSRKPVPRFDEKLLEWAASTDPAISEQALYCLAELEHPRIRAFALNHLRQPGARLIPDVIPLFGKNWQAGDAELIHAALWVPDDPDTAHDFVLDIINLSSSIKSPEMRDLWLWAYEHSPCGECRGSAVRYLTELNLAPRELLIECLVDSNDETRDLARAVLEKGGEKGN